jgi:hypothetical protein
MAAESHIIIPLNNGTSFHLPEQSSGLRTIPRTIPLETLLALLRADGFKDISTTAILDIQKVLANLDEEEIKDYRKLKYLLSPIICRNKEDQEKFSQTFDQYVEVIERETKSRSRIAESPKRSKYTRRIVIAVLAVAFILALLFIILPGKKAPRLSLSQTTYWPSGKYGEDAVGDSIGYEAFLQDTIAGKKYTVDWQLDDTSYANSRNIRKVYSDTGSHIAYAHVKDEKGKTVITDSIITSVVSEHRPSVSIQRADESNKKIYTAVPSDSSVKATQYKYKWYINDSLSFERKEFPTGYRSNKPYEIKLVVDSRGLYSNKNYDSLTASVREMPEYSLMAKGLSAIQTSSVFQAGNLLWMIAAMLLIPSGVAFLIFRFWKKPKRLQTDKPDDTLPVEKKNEGPFFIEFKEQDHKISPEEQISRLADGLRKRQLSDVYKLHLKKTIYKTIRAGGFPSFEFSPKTKPVDFLVLIDKEYPEGHLVKLFEYLVDRLRSEEVNIIVYDYYKEPLYLNNTKFNHIHIPLERVAQLYPDTVLFLFTTGEYFFEPLKSKLKPWAEEKFKAWENRIIITPIPRKDWAYKEAILQQSGFAIISADLYQNNLLKILLDFVSLQVETTKKEKIEIPQTYSARYFNFQEFGALEKYLDNSELLNWVSATAVYPSVDWKVTVAIGKALEEEAKSNKLVTYENLLKISRISWMQDGIIDDTLRLEMLRYIDNTTEAVARKAIVELLEEIKEQFTEKSFAKEEFDLHHNSNSLLLYAHDKSNLVSDETTAAVREYISKGYLDWPQSVYHQEARNTLLRKENGTVSVPPEEYFKNSDKNNGDKKQQDEELRQKEKRRKRLRNLTAAASLLLLSFIGGWLLKQNGLLQLRKILPATLNIVLSQTEQLKQLGDITLSLKIDTLYAKGKKENDSVFVFDNIPVRSEDKQPILFLEPAGGNQISTPISLDSSYLISLAEPTPRIPLYIRYNNQDFYSAIEQKVTRELYHYNIDALQQNFNDSSRLIYYSEDQKAMADSIATIMKDKLAINVRTEFVRENRTPPAVPILFLNLGARPPCSAVAVPKILNEIWHGGTSNRLININLAQQIIYYSVNDTKTFGTYRIDEICLGSNGIYKVITRAGNQYQVFLLSNIQSSSFELSVCQNRYNTKEEARAIDETYCDKFNAMRFYYENDKSKIYLPVRSVGLLSAEAAKIRMIADSFNIVRKQGRELKLTTAVYENDKYLSPLAERTVLKYLPDNNLNYDLKNDDWLKMPSPNPFKRNYITIETEAVSVSGTTSKETNLGTIRVDAKGYPDSKSLELINNVAKQLRANSKSRIRLEATYTSDTEQKSITGYVRTIKNLFYKEGINEKLQPIDDKITAMQYQQQQQQNNIQNKRISDYTNIKLIGINFPDNSRNRTTD